MMASMRHAKTINSIRTFILNGLHIKLTPGNKPETRNVANIFHALNSQVSDKTIQHLLKNPNARLRIQVLKPKPDDQPNGRRNKR